MQYPKPVMKATELEKMGFPREFLDFAFKKNGQGFAWKSNPTKPNSPVLFDTEAFEKWRLSLAKGKAGAFQ